MNPLPIDPDDPRLTAWALNELSPAERAELERGWQADAAARAAAEEIRGFTQLLAQTLRDEPMPALKPEQRAAIAAASLRQAPTIPAPRPWRRILVAVVLNLTAAAVVIGLTTTFWGRNAGPRPLASATSPRAVLDSDPYPAPSDAMHLKLTQSNEPLRQSVDRRSERDGAGAPVLAHAPLAQSRSLASDPARPEGLIRESEAAPGSAPGATTSLAGRFNVSAPEPAVAGRPTASPAGPADAGALAGTKQKQSEALNFGLGMGGERGARHGGRADGNKQVDGYQIGQGAPVADDSKSISEVSKRSAAWSEKRSEDRSRSLSRLAENKPAGEKGIAYRGDQPTEARSSLESAAPAPVPAAKPAATYALNPAPVVASAASAPISGSGSVNEHYYKSRDVSALGKAPQPAVPLGLDAPHLVPAERSKDHPSDPSDKLKRETVVLRKSLVESESEQKLAAKLAPDGNARLVDALGDQDQVVPQLQVAEPESAEAYEGVVDNLFVATSEQPISTFSIDVDTASYTNVRRFLTHGQLPPPAAVRIEELINYFQYDYPQPTGDVPFSVNMELAECPWTPGHQLLRVGLQGKTIARDQRPVSNLVFLIDVSGSMQDPNKLPLVKTGLRLLVEQLGENDRVAIVVYAGATGMVLDSTTADHKAQILASLDNLQAGGSTNGGAGIELAYRVAVDHFIKGGANRVVLCTDGDFNVGVTDRNQLTNLIIEKAKSGVFLSVLGFGMGNLKDATLESLANKGNGMYAYIDSEQEARKVLVEQMQGTLITIAKDVKIQVEFQPRRVAAYRLIGYENRLLATEDFNNDQKDAGEIGAGHTVTVLYELTPAKTELAGVDAEAAKPLSGPAALPAAPATETARGVTENVLELRLRYKAPDADTSRLIEFPLPHRSVKFSEASRDMAFASAVASFGMLLRHSPHAGNNTWEAVLEVAQASQGSDASGRRAEFVELVKRAKDLLPSPVKKAAGPAAGESLPPR